MNIHLSLGFYISCNSNQAYIEILNKKKINNLLKVNNPIFFNIHDYINESKIIIPFYMTNKMDDLYQVKKWHCFNYIFVNKTLKQCILLYCSSVGIYTKSFSNQNMYLNYIEKLYHKLKSEKYFDTLLKDKFSYSVQIYDPNDLSQLFQLFDLNLEPFHSINNLIDHKKLDMIQTIQDFRDLEYLFFTIFHMEFKARISDEKTSMILELNDKLNKKREYILQLESENKKLSEQIVKNSNYLQNEFNEFLFEVKKKLNEIEIPVYEKNIVPEYHETHCVICSELLKDECVFVESSKTNPWEYKDKKESIVDFIDVSEKFHCGHLFHKNCIENWLRTQKPESVFVTEDQQLVYCGDDYTYKTCPLCKGYIIRLIVWKPEKKDS